MPRHLTIAEIEDELPEILRSPKDNGRLEGIVVRPGRGERQEPTSCDVSLEGGVQGDHWAKGCRTSTKDGHPHPDVQICIMNSRCIAVLPRSASIGRRLATIFFIDMDLSPDNLPPG